LHDYLTDSRLTAAR